MAMRTSAGLLICIVFAALGGCMSARKMASAPMTMAAASLAAPAAPPPLDRSVFARDPNGQLSEDALQKILGSPIELDLPSRVGVLPILTAQDWRGPGPDYDHVPPGVAPLVARLRRDPSFSLVTEMMPIPSGALGMEALREVAARYRLRYVILYREVIAKTHYHGGWAVGYATGLGALFLPGRHNEVYGYIEATMFDVKTGLLMFTTRRAVVGEERTNEWHTDTKLAKLASATTSSAAPALATDVLSDVRRFAAAAIAENEKLHVPADALVHAPSLPAPPPAIATDAH